MVRRIISKLKCQTNKQTNKYYLSNHILFPLFLFILFTFFLTFYFSLFIVVIIIVIKVIIIIIIIKSFVTIDRLAILD